MTGTNREKIRLLYRCQKEKKRVQDAAKLPGEKFGFLKKCVCFIMEDDGYSGRENYAEWLNNRDVKK